MAERSFPLENTLYTAEDAQLWLSARTTGVYSAENNLAVSAAGGMNVKVTAGLAWLNWAKFKGVAYANTEELILAAAPADGVLDRIDRVVVRYDQMRNVVELAVKKGVSSSSPVPPALERQGGVAYEIALADIFVGRGAITLTAANITDVRMNESLCGIMRDGVTRIPTQTLYDNWQAFLNDKRVEFGAWFGGIQEILNENIAAELLDKINAEKQRIDALTQRVDTLSAIPRGCILMWSGTAATIPSGWRLCDGTNSTPNLRDRFIVGAGTSYSPGNTGGAASVSLSAAQLASHSHTWTLGSGTIQSGGISGITRANPIINGAHGHLQFDGPTPAIYGAAHKFDTATSAAGSGTAHENRPPYYALCFIMKT